MVASVIMYKKNCQCNKAGDMRAAYVASVRAFVLFQTGGFGIGFFAAIEGAVVYASRVQQELPVHDDRLARCTRDELRDRLVF
jgi:hypothetical protein